ncbi:hypothetical protein [Sphingomonas jatrophae]|uniref:Uncharacterized protein n=1 Tax=Sphingomonas jatrophae TaxID=1166337 RepID=A0A1I6LKZ4_9SPHN|nr:hypothetical protein [Sphingomonas jatrophae]SFS04165.1 hypothetical protein SAMN05192580_2888 [Sphingomonas jatrophae]
MKIQTLFAALLMGASATAAHAGSIPEPVILTAERPAGQSRAMLQRAAIEERMGQRQLDLLVSGIVGDAQERAAAKRLDKLTLVDFHR